MLSIIIPNWNTKNHLRICLSSIEKHTVIPHRVIVVDNGSDDGSAEMVRKEFQEVELIRNRRNAGFAHAVNQGIRISKGDVFLLNTDTEVNEDWYDGILEAARLPNVGIVGCKLIFPDGRIQHVGCSVKPWGIIRHGYGEEDGGQWDSVRDADYVTGAAMLIRREVIRRIGLFDEGFSPAYYEETDYCWRAKKAGFRVVYTPKTTIIHHELASSKNLPDMAYYIEKNRLRFMLLNFPVSWLFLSIPVEFVRFLIAPVKGKTKVLFKAHLFTFLHLREILKSRR